LAVTVYRSIGRCWFAAIAAAILGTPAFASEAPVATARPSVDDLLAVEGSKFAAVSPSGKFIATVVRHKDRDVLVLIDATSGSMKGLARVALKEFGERFDAHITSVYWKSEDRLLFRVLVDQAEGVDVKGWNANSVRFLGTRLWAIDRDGGNMVRMLENNTNVELAWAYNLGEIRSFLQRDPDHILMLVDGGAGRSLFKVNVRTGEGSVVEHADNDVIDWWLDLDGKPLVRVDISNGFLRFFRHEDDEEWTQYHKVRVRELKQQDDYEPLGPSDHPRKYYVLARPEGAQRRGIYLYDLEQGKFGEPVAENPQFDMTAGFISRDGKRVMRYCYVAHVEICESADTRLNAHMKGVRKYFQDSANVYMADSSEDDQTLLLLVEGPSDPPAYYYYRLEAKHIQRIGYVQDSLQGKALPTATLVTYQARDGVQLMGYLTRPSGATNATQLPLVMMPHGGPELRDHLAFDYFVQYFASRGYAVFQPNFRGSAGFGRDFAESGYGQWGRKMQDDITDAVTMLIEQKVADPARVCIVGASYGGYAALAGAAFTPDLYKCVVAIAGPANLREFLRYRLKTHGIGSELYAYWMRLIGDPKVDAERIAAISPELHVARIKAPILLIHGDQDVAVPYDQSRDMKKALDKSGRKTRLITLEDEGHSFWSRENTRLVLTSAGDFLEHNIGPGFGRTPENK